MPDLSLDTLAIHVGEEPDPETGLEDPQDLMADLDQALQARTVKGLVGPAAYAVLKRFL